MTSDLRVLLVLAVSGASALLSWRRVPRLREPAPDPSDPFVKPPYASLPRRDREVVLLVSAIGLGFLCLGLPGWCAPAAWALLAGGGSVLAMVDLLTTYLPTAILRPLTVLAATLLLADAAPTLVHSPAQGAALLARMLCCTLASRALFWGMWRWRAGIGHGDVRLVTLVGLLTSRVSASLWITALVLGTLAGAIWGLAVLAHRRRHPSPLGNAFAYGPALVLGCWAALALHLVGAP